MKDAAKFYHGKERYNCAQAILKCFQEEYGVSQEMIDSFRAYGSGRAEGNLCGALFAAKYLLKNKELSGKIEEEFKAKAGDIQCKVIRKLNHLPCAGCVQTAADALEKLETQASKIQPQRGVIDTA